MKPISGRSMPTLRGAPSMNDLELYLAEIEGRNGLDGQRQAAQ